MRRIALVFSFLFLTFYVSISQHQSDACWKNNNKRFQTKFVKSIDILAGAVPNPDYNALKLDLVASNIILKIVGFYTSVEIGMDSEYLTNTWGMNVSVFRFVYLYGGIDIFTSYGYISSTLENTTNGTRKELGVGVYPFKNLTFRTGYTTEVGFTFTLGYRIIFKTKVGKYKPKRNKQKLPAYFRNVE